MRPILARTLMMTGLIVLGLAGVTRANPLSGCGSCFGMTYALQYDPSQTTTAGSDTVYDLFFVISTAGYTGNSTDVIKTATVKIASSVDVPPSTLVNAPGGVGAWTLQIGGQNSSGCNGNGAGFICAADSTHAPVTPATTYTWEFHYATTTSLLTGNLASDIKADFYDSTGQNFQGQLSNGITLQTCSGANCSTIHGGPPNSPIPEPGSIVLLASLACFLAVVFKKRARAQA
jgi:hypothetical protein